MSKSINRRLLALGLGVALMGGAMVVLVLNTERRANQMRAQLGEMDVESFQFADRFRDKLRLANDKMRRYATAGDRVAWDEFLEASAELQRWIQQQQTALNTAEERDTTRALFSGYQAYARLAGELHTRLEATHEAGASVAEYNSFFEQSRRLNDLGEELARAHLQYRKAALAGAGRALTELRFSVIGSLGLLFVFAVALAVVVYRDLIAPLRVQLVESRAVAERNEKLASLGLLAAGVAHEIRNPLTALKTALFLQQRNAAPGGIKSTESDLLEREILRLERIVNEFLDFARPAKPRLATIPAADALASVQSLLAPQLAAAQIRLLKETGEPLPIRVDPAQLQQVLINLVQNAAESIGRNGTVNLRARGDRRRLAGKDTAVVAIEVVDTGKGIPAEIQKRLFDPFFTTKEKGTGLGLSIAARMVEMNGGLLEFQTQLNRGSTFRIILPHAQAPAPRLQECVPSPGL